MDYRKRLIKVVALEPIQPILNRKAVIGGKVVDGHGDELVGVLDDMGLVDVAIHKPQFLNADSILDAKVGNQLLFAVIGFARPLADAQDGIPHEDSFKPIFPQREVRPNGVDFSPLLELRTELGGLALPWVLRWEWIRR